MYIIKAYTNKWINYISVNESFTIQMYTYGNESRWPVKIINTTTVLYKTHSFMCTIINFIHFIVLMITSVCVDAHIGIIYTKPANNTNTS